jgi:hypothetical protein
MQFNTTSAGIFSVACLGAHAWAVAYSRQLIPGAILKSREAAIKYVTEIAKAAGLPKVRLDIIDGAAMLAVARARIGAE